MPVAGPGTEWRESHGVFQPRGGLIVSFGVIHTPKQPVELAVFRPTRGPGGRPLGLASPVPYRTLPSAA